MEPPTLPFSLYRKAGGLLFCAGQVGSTTGDLLADGIKAQTIQAAANIATVLALAGLSLDDVVDVVAFLTNQEDYDAFNEAYERCFKPPYPTRTCVTVKSLPIGALVELRAIALGSADS